MTFEQWQDLLFSLLYPAKMHLFVFKTQWYEMSCLVCRSNMCQIRAYFMLPMNNARQGWNLPLIVYKYHVMELMSGKLIPTSLNMKPKLALGHLVTCELFLFENISFWTLNCFFLVNVSFYLFRWTSLGTEAHIAVKMWLSKFLNLNA